MIKVKITEEEEKWVKALKRLMKKTPSTLSFYALTLDSGLHVSKDVLMGIDDKGLVDYSRISIAYIHNGEIVCDNASWEDEVFLKEGVDFEFED